jgi:hypothetical protein
VNITLGIPTVTHPGRRRRADGSPTRLDIEHGQYVGRLKTPHLTLRKVVTGTQEYVTQQMQEWR